MVREDTTAEQKAASVLYMADPMRKEQNIQAAKINVKQLLTGVGRHRYHANEISIVYDGADWCRRFPLPKG